MAEIKRQPNRRKVGFSDLFLMLIFTVVVIGIVMFAFGDRTKAQELTSDEFMAHLKVTQDVKDMLVKQQPGDANEKLWIVSGKLNNDTKYVTTISDIELDIAVKYVADNNLQTIITYEPNANLNWINILMIIGSVALVGFMLFFVMRNNTSSNTKAFEFGKSRARLTRKSGVNFNDVAGLKEEKEELIEIVDFLKNPQKYFAMGARIPKGILLVGAPGTGKTLLARAVAGEANVPFYSISGSDFVEMFVGVGASRVRDMFKTAKQTAPCIIFIDEIDAVGRQRGAGLGGGHDEREQTLNQLLVEMDGFEGKSGIIMMAATNRPDVLDPALLRPGRFDRQITISNPDVVAREDILKVHARNKKLSKKVNLADIARRTPGFTGADLENILNEAALLAARENATEIKIYHIDEAIDRVMMGPAKRSKKYTEREKALVSYHEAGHAVIGLKLKHAQIVQKITIVPRGEAGGYNLMTPEEETFLETKNTLLASITSFLAGRASEELVFGEMTTGAHNDFQKATAIARSMVTEYGMSKLGPIQYERQTQSVFLGRDYMTDKNFSDHVAHEIDEAVREIITSCYTTAQDTLKEFRNLLDILALHLVEIETLTKEDIDEIVSTGKLAWWEKKKAKMKEFENQNQPQQTTDTAKETPDVSNDAANYTEREKMADDKETKGTDH
jgi:cell division protease FtsH